MTTRVVYYRTGYRHQLAEDFELDVSEHGIFSDSPGGNDYVQLTLDGCLIVRKGYAWDGASGPAINTKSFVRPSLVHDALYQLIRMEVFTDRLAADKLLGKMLREDSMIIADRQPWYARWPLKALAVVRPLWVEAAVRWFGGMAINLHADEILTAP